MKNFLIDSILLALYVAELCFHQLPKILHEVFGVAMVAVIVVHVAINFRRFLNQFNNMSPKKFFSMEVNLALILAAAVILLTGLCLSNYLFPDLMHYSWRHNMTILNLHKSAPYVMMILIGMHVGLHWQELRQRFLNLFGLTNFYVEHKKIFRAAMLILAALGVAGFFLNRLATRLMMKHIFSTPATDLPAPIFILMMIGGVIFFALITRLIVAKFFRR